MKEKFHKRPEKSRNFEENLNKKAGLDDAVILDGLQPVMELLESQPEKIDTVFLRKGHAALERSSILDVCRSKGVRFVLSDAKSFAKLYPKAQQGLVARLYPAGFLDLDEFIEKAKRAPLPLVIALDQVQDTGNVGTLARSLYAFGGAGIVIPKHNSAYLGLGAMRAAKGALEKLPITKVTNLAQSLDKFINEGFTVYATSAPTESSVNVFDSPLNLPAVLVLGNEGEGIRHNVQKRCDLCLHIPMFWPESDSINVAQAGSIIAAYFLHKHKPEKR